MLAQGKRRSRATLGMKADVKQTLKGFFNRWADDFVDGRVNNPFRVVSQYPIANWGVLTSFATPGYGELRLRRNICWLLAAGCWLSAIAANYSRKKILLR